MKHPFSKPLFLLILAILALAAAAGLCVFLYQQIAAAGDKARLAEDVIAAEQGAADQSKDIETQYDSTAALRARLPGLFVPAADEVSFIEAVEATGPASGATVSISAIHADDLDGAPAGTTGNISADVDAQGSWTAVMRALVLAESLPYQGIVDDVDLSASKDAWGMSYTVSATILAGQTGQ